MIASLPMYDWAEVAPATDRLWAGIRDGLRGFNIAAPETLTRGAANLFEQWTSPDLVLSQTCGFPFRAKLHDKVTLLGTPDFGVEDCQPGFYRSVFVARVNDPRDGLAAFHNAPFAYNEAMSQSGWAAPQTHAAGLGLRFPPALQSGGHRFSARAVAEGRADLAALDAVTWRLITQHDAGIAKRLRVVGMTDPTPGLPYISAVGADAGRMFAVIAQAIADLPATDRSALGLHGFIAIPATRYLAVPTPPAPAQFAPTD